MLKTSLKVMVVLLLVMVSTTYAAYKPSNLDTKRPPIEVTYDIEKPDEATLIYEAGDLSFYFKDERDVLMIYDNRNGYTWKSGLDIGYSKDIKDALKDGDPLGYEPIEDKLNTTYTGIANSLITVEYYDDSLGIKRLASAAYEGASSSLNSVVGEDNHFVLDIAYDEIDLSLRVHLYLSETGYNIQVYYDEIVGADKNIMAAIMLNPFMGASGGAHKVYDPVEGEHGDAEPKEMIPGYVLVPDGSGALIRFNDYSVSMKTYEGDVYGENLSKSTYNVLGGFGLYTPFKNPLMPLYGVAHGNRQAAFIGYGESGDNHMEIIVSPEENTTLYTYAYPRFEYNDIYYQVFNKRGEGYFALQDEPDQFDIDFTYEFLAGEGEHGYPADYVGMAMTYRDHLMDTGVLEAILPEYEEVPVRVDFVMSDLKKSVIGYEDVVVTTADQTKNILTQIQDLGVSNMNVGLYGWQDDGIVGGKPWQTDWLRAIGTKRDFEDLLSFGVNQGVDISFAQDYVHIQENQVSLNDNAAKHLNNWYLYDYLFDDVPFQEFYFARPEKSAEWLMQQTDRLADIGITSHTIEGMSNMLLSHHGSSDALEEEGTMTLYQETMDNLDDTLRLNMEAPNQYLWAYTDRFLQTPVYPTQYLIETDTVPFLEMVLNGTMELYAPYSNFSFSEQKDVLRMIDYNVYPSFVLTYEESHYLSNTNAMDYYSTGYTQYLDKIQQIQATVNGALSPVIGANWVDRQVLENGIIKNEYDNGVSIVINYTEAQFTYDSYVIEPLSYMVIREGGIQ